MVGALNHTDNRTPAEIVIRAWGADLTARFDRATANDLESLEAERRLFARLVIAHLSNGARKCRQ